MIPFGSYNMMFVFASERGVYAMLGVNVWLHNIPYENCIKISPLDAFTKAKRACLNELCVFCAVE